MHTKGKDYIGFSEGVLVYLFSIAAPNVVKQG